MLSGKWKKLLIVSLAFLLLTSMVIPATAQQTEEEVAIHEIPAVGTVYIDGKSYFKMKKAHITPDSNGNQVIFTIALVNRSSSDIMFVDYWLKLLTDGGSNYSIDIIPSDRDKNRVSPNSTEEFTFTATVGSSVDLSDLNIHFIEWDFSLPNYEKSLGSIAIPDDYNTTVPAGSAGLVNLKDTNLKAYIDRVSVNETERHHKTTIDFVINNVGARSANLDDFTFYVQTEDGLNYPLTLNQSGLVLQPKVEEDIKLKADIPSSVPMENLNLVMAQSVDNLSIPVGEFELPEVSTQEGGAVGTEYSFVTDDGEYHVTLESISRLPLDNNDIISANVVLANKSNETLPIPKLAGVFTLDDAVDSDAELIITDQVVGLQPGKSIQLKFFSTIPYTYEFSNIQLALEEIESAGEGGQVRSDLLEFEHTADLMQIPVIAANESHVYESIGKRSTFNIREVNTFEGKSQNIFSIQMLVRNDEKRLSKLIDMVPNLHLADGTIYPMQLSEIESQIRPNGHALVHIWTQLPKDTSTDDAQLILGEAVTSGGQEGAALVAYINPVSYTVPTENLNVTDDLTELDFYPYTISINKLTSSIQYGENTLTIDFDYTLDKDTLVETNNPNQRLIIELEDTAADVKFEKSYAFEGNGDGSGADYVLELGSHSGVFEAQDNELVFKIETLKDFNLRVYYEYEPGHKKLIADKTVGWFKTFK